MFCISQKDAVLNLLWKQRFRLTYSTPSGKFWYQQDADQDMLYHSPGVLLCLNSRQNINCVLTSFCKEVRDWYSWLKKREGLWVLYIAIKPCTAKNSQQSQKMPEILNDFFNHIMARTRPACLKVIQIFKSQNTSRCSDSGFRVWLRVCPFYDRFNFKKHSISGSDMFSDLHLKWWLDWITHCVHGHKQQRRWQIHE